MSVTVFCSDCGSLLDFEDTLCECGYELTLTEKTEMSNQLIDVFNNTIIDEQFKEVAIQSHQHLINNYLLDDFYFSSTSAKKDYEKKVNFLKSDLLPRINDWSETIQAGEKKVAKDKIEIYSRVIAITDFVLKEFFGPFTIKDNGLENFIEFRDFGKYKISETIFDANLDFSDIKTESFGTIGNNIMDSVGATLQHGSFKELSNKSEWSNADVKRVKTEVGIAVAGELISGIGNMIGQTRQAIKNVRIADKELNDKLEEISNVLNALSIEENEIGKQKILCGYCDIILETCFNKILQPIVDELNNDPVYLEYRKARTPFDIEQEIIKIDKETLDTNIKISFWGCLLRNKRQNYRSNWKKRIKHIGKFNRYNELISSLKIKAHSSLEEFRFFDNQKLIEFQEFEKINRRTLKRIPVISENKQIVMDFARVISQIKTHIAN
jgi:hypothetical protein